MWQDPDPHHTYEEAIQLHPEIGATKRVAVVLDEDGFPVLAPSDEMKLAAQGPPNVVRKKTGSPMISKYPQPKDDWFAEDKYYATGTRHSLNRQVSLAGQ